MADAFETQGVKISLNDSSDEYPYPNYPEEHQTPDIDLVNSDNEPTAPQSSKHESRSRAKRSRKVTSRIKSMESKPKLRPAKDILSRIRHDPSLNIDDYVVGYHDRHLPEVQEMDVALWKGGGDVTDEEFIPGHRIAWFRLKGEGGRKVWDRSERLDRIFGSGVLENEGKDQGGESPDIESPDDESGSPQAGDQVGEQEARP